MLPIVAAILALLGGGSKQAFITTFFWAGIISGVGSVIVWESPPSYRTTREQKVNTLYEIITILVILTLLTI